MWFFGLIVVLLIGAVAVVASGRWGAMAPAYDDRPDMTVPARQALTADDLEKARFGVGLRGYRMDEVDTLLERVAREVAERDRRIADLERAVSPIIHGPEGAGFTARADYQPADFDDTGNHKPILVGGDFPTADQDAIIGAEAPPTPATPADPEAQAAPQPEPDPAPTTPPAAAAASAAEAPAEPWFEEAEPASVLDGQPQPPVPLPPMLQELVHTSDDAGSESWFQAKEPPPEYSEEALAENAAASPVDAETDGPDDEDDEDDEDETGDLPRGRHSAAPDVTAVQQRPN
jgi:DivIVA domain-containing protein